MKIQTADRKLLPIEFASRLLEIKSDKLERSSNTKTIPLHLQTS